MYSGFEDVLELLILDKSRARRVYHSTTNIHLILVGVMVRFGQDNPRSYKSYHFDFGWPCEYEKDKYMSML